ncbi:MAG TPA: hypothetical protein VFU05_11735 [Cyclobacteriaceae bacterium]|nr:hypothetical protein [Cyclobacteriaceae bacterium]
MINPYSLYCIGFLAALALYPLNWSSAYPALKVPLVVFISCTLIAHFVLSKYWSKVKPVTFHKTQPPVNPIHVTIFIYCLWIIDFVYEGSIPLLNILLDKPFNYRLFGMPGLHVLAVTISSFYTLYLFHAFLSERKRVLLALYLTNLSASILIISRSMLFFILIGSSLLYLFTLDKIPFRKLMLALPLLIVVFYLFGVVGNKRSAVEDHVAYNPDIFLETGRATENFRESLVPKEFFWAYIYISSPIANLQMNINHHTVPPISMRRVLEYVNNEFLFESISKRINTMAGINRQKAIIIKHPFNVSTIYSTSYTYIGWPGMITMAIFILALPLLYFKMLSKNNTYSVTAYAILCTMYLFFIYDNTIRLMGWGFLLVYPAIIPFVDRFLNRNK